MTGEDLSEQVRVRFFEKFWEQFYSTGGADTRSLIPVWDSLVKPHIVGTVCGGLDPEREIERLESEVARLKGVIDRTESQVPATCDHLFRHVTDGRDVLE